MVDAEPNASRLRISLRTLMEVVFVLGVLFVFVREYYQRTIKAGDLLEIQATGTLIDQPINGVYTVDDEGEVSLGPAYGRVTVANLSVAAAEAAVVKKLSAILRGPEVAVSRIKGNAPVELLQLQAENRRLLFDNSALKMELARLQSTPAPSAPAPSAPAGVLGGPAPISGNGEGDENAPYVDEVVLPPAGPTTP